MFTGIYLLGNFNPFYEGSDSFSYSVTAKILSTGSFVYSNELLQNSGRAEFIPEDWILGINGKNAFPAGYAGFFGIATFFYIIGGPYGLFFLGPLFGIIFLITSERIATKFFGRYVGLLTLLFLSTNHLFYRSALNLQTESVSTIFLLIGVYFLILFFYNKKNQDVFIASILFTIGTLTKINGIIFFPIELILIVGYFLTLIIIEKKSSRISNKSNSKNLTQKILYKFRTKQTLKIGILITLPWIIFFVFWFSYYGIFFGDPFTNHVVILEGSENTDKQLSSIFKLNSKNFENVKQYSKYLLPYQFPRIVDTLDIFKPINDTLGKNWLGLIAILLLIVFVLVSLKTKDNRLKLIVFSSFIIGTVWFFSVITTEYRASLGVPGRYMFPAFALYYMIISFMIFKITNSKTILQKNKMAFNSLKIITITILILFFVGAFYLSPPVQALKNDEFIIKNPISYAERYPLDSEGLSNKDILLTVQTDNALDRNLIPFHLTINKDKTVFPESFELLSQTINDGYNVFIPKEPRYLLDKIIYRDLEDNFGVIFKDYTESFCKIELIKKTDNRIAENISDETCI